MQYFAILREQRGLARGEARDRRDARPPALYEELRTRHGFTLPADRVRAAVNDEFVPGRCAAARRRSRGVHPAGGGRLNRCSKFRTAEPHRSGGACKKALPDPRAGACVTFEGWVRDRNEGQAVQSLEYEAYVPLAEKEGAQILAEAREKFALMGAACVHRVGHLALGELAVWVGVTAEHRGAAFEACRYIIDEAKARLPIWKQEHYAERRDGLDQLRGSGRTSREPPLPETAKNG